MGLHDDFPYQWEATEGITFPTIPSVAWKYDYDLAIYYNTLTDNDYVEGRCSRWDVQNYSIIVETWLEKSDLQNLKTYTRPGAVGELYKILGRPTYYDQTWTAANTLRLFPTPSSNKSKHSNLNTMRSETIIYPKNISWGNVPGTEDWISCKIEGFVSGNAEL